MGDPGKTTGMTAGAEPPDAWLISLRDRFVSIAGRRVPPDAIDDVVQDALAVVFDRGLRLGEGRDEAGRPVLAWCFQVLRNTIGNFYQREKTRGKYVDQTPTGDDTFRAPFDALDRLEMKRAMETALSELSDGGGACATYLTELGRGTTPAELAEREGVNADVLYRRVYRCRQRLRELLLTRGITV
jgi:RNA polymerase sigma factor (sigma-70 family)